MITNELLQEKWRTQMRLAQEAGYNIKHMLDNSEKLVAQMLREHGTTLAYVEQDITQRTRTQIEVLVRETADSESTGCARRS